MTLPEPTLRALGALPVALLLSLAAQAQVTAGGDDCAAATVYTLPAGGSDGGLFDNCAATDDGFASPFNCLSDAGTGPAAELGDVWFRVESAEDALEVVVEAYDAGGNGLPDPQFLVFESNGGCGGYTLLACATDLGGGTARTIVTNLNPARPRFVLVSGADGACGEFRITVTSRASTGDPAADCAGAVVLCDVSLDPAPVDDLIGVGDVANESFRDGCLDGLESNTYWYKFSVATGGRLAFTLTPEVASDDLDFALYRIPDLRSCPTTDVAACQTGRVPANTSGETGLRAGAGGDFGAERTVAAGEVYALLVNASGPASGEGFSLSLAGTTAAFGQADVAFDVDLLSNACGEARFLISPTGPLFADVPGVSYSWTFGNPPDEQVVPGRRNSVYTATASGTIPFTYTITTPYPGCDNASTLTQNLALVEGGVQIGAPVVEQPSCGAGATPTGTVTFDAPPPSSLGYIYSYTRDGGLPQEAGPDPVFDDLPPGEYVFNVIPLDGCPSRSFGPYILAVPAGTVPVRRDDLSIAAPTCGVPTGTLTVPLGSGGARTFSVDDGPDQTSNVFAGLAPGPHFVDIDEVGACGVRLEFEIPDVPPAPVLGTPDVTPASCEVAADGLVEVVIESSPPGQRLYSIDGGTPQSSPTFGGLAADLYAISVTAGGSCASEQTALVTVGEAEPLSQPAVAPPTCAGSLSGQIAPGVGDAPGTVYSLDGIDYTGGPIFRDLEAETYTLYGRSPEGCVSTAQVIVPEGEPLALEAEATAPGCAGADDGRLQLVSLGRTFEYALEDGPYGPSRVFDGLEARSYLVRARDTEAPFCEGEAVVDVPLPGPEAGRLELGGPTEISYGTAYVVDAAALTDLGSSYTFAYSGIDPIECVDADCQVVSVAPLETTDLLVSTVSPAGCVLTGSLTISVSVDAGVYLPTAFSPDGDGTNEVWRPRVSPAVGRIFAVRVYDRLGAAVFETFDPPLTPDMPGWRGTVGDDAQEASTGVYVAVVEAEVAGQRQVFTGDVTLVR